MRLINLRPGVDQRLLDWAISVIGVIVFVGLTAYDTQRIKEMYDVNDDGTISGRKAVMGALRLYLDFMHGDRERPLGGAFDSNGWPMASHFVEHLPYQSEAATVAFAFASAHDGLV